MNEPIDAYADMLHLQAPRPKNRHPMPRRDRAAQFSAFAALTGHGDAIRETARLTESRPELSEGAKAEIDARLQCLLQSPGCTATLTWFVQDPLKAGGACYTTTGEVRRLNAAARLVELADGRSIPLDDILALELH